MNIMKWIADSIGEGPYTWGGWNRRLKEDKVIIFWYSADRYTIIEIL